MSTADDKAREAAEAETPAKGFIPTGELFQARVMRVDHGDHSHTVVSAYDLFTYFSKLFESEPVRIALPAEFALGLATALGLPEEIIDSMQLAFDRAALQLEGPDGGTITA